MFLWLKTANIILNRIYNNKDINKGMHWSEMKELLYLCTKNVHFHAQCSLNGNIYIQNDGVAMAWGLPWFLHWPIYLFIYNEYLFATGLPLQHAKLLFFKWVLWGLKYTIKFPIHIYQ